MNQPRHILPIIVISQFFCTSLWFAGNGVMSELIANFGLEQSALGYLTSSVQIGFITGTLLFAIFSISDRFSPSKVFFICSVLGAVFNLFSIWDANTFTSILLFRFLTGFFLAGIYPVGMKIAADYYEKGLGKSLAFLVGALVIGTAFPHLLKGVKNGLQWEAVLIITSSLSVAGGIFIMFLVPDGPYRKPSQKINLLAIPKIFKVIKFRSAAIGYFGHMWELYTFWTFVPFILKSYLNNHPGASFNIPLLSFTIIGIGGIACILGGYLSQKVGVKKIALLSLLFSCLCCLILPVIFYFGSQVMFVTFLLFWGMVVIADSPLFSTLVAQNAPIELKGTALTIVNSIGFFLTVISIQLVDYLRVMVNSPAIFTILAIGPIIGLIVNINNKKKSIRDY